MGFLSVYQGFFRLLSQAFNAHPYALRDDLGSLSAQLALLLAHPPRKYYHEPQGYLQLSPISAFQEEDILPRLLTLVGGSLEGYQELLLGLASGVTQGVFEWIPVSSKTMLLLEFYWMGVPASTAYLLGLFLNGSTAAAAAIYFRKDLFEMLKGLWSGGEGRSLLFFLIFSTSATGITAIPLAALVSEYLKSLDNLSMLVVGLLYLAMSLLLWLKAKLPQRTCNLNPLRDGVLAGLAQGFSALPGVSRSGTTILALLALGHRPKEALRLSFLMSIPATLGGTAYVALIRREALTTIPPTVLASSSIAAIAVSILAITTLLKASEKLKPHILTLLLALITILTAALPTQTI